LVPHDFQCAALLSPRIEKRLDEAFLLKASRAKIENLRSGHRLLQRPSPGKQFPGNVETEIHDIFGWSSD